MDRGEEKTLLPRGCILYQSHSATSSLAPPEIMAHNLFFHSLHLPHSFMVSGALLVETFKRGSQSKQGTNTGESLLIPSEGLLK